MDLTGRTFGHLRIDALIGRGGMGAVYRGFDLRLKRPVAVKALRRKGRETPAGRARFTREARLLSRLNHPGICRVHDLIEHNETDLLVLELISGQNLSEMDTASLSFEQRLILARDIADALAAAHRQLILHRDLKPDNVMVTDDGQVKLLDFGIARPLEIDGSVPGRGLSAGTGAAGAEAAEAARSPLETNPLGLSDQELTQMATSLAGLGDDPHSPNHDSPGQGSSGDSSHVDETFHTVRGVTLGTMAYMSPEQALGRELGVSSDLYALGVILQELFTGVRAYPRMPVAQLFERVARAQTEPLNGLGPRLTELIGELEHVDPEARPSAEETRDRLQRLIDRPYRLRRRRQRWAAAAAAVFLLVASVSAVVHSRFESRRQAALAERFAQEASAIEWLLRAEHLSPVHSIVPARKRVSAQLASLEARLDDAGAVGRGAGSYALGRAYLALDDLVAAEQRLSTAWESGYQLPEVASYLGLAMVELHRQQASKARRTVDDATRDERLEALDLELRQPGIELLKTGRLAGPHSAGQPVLSIEPSYYPRALVALEEDRLEEALDLARQSGEALAWFYEADLLASQIRRQQAAAASAKGDYEQAEARLKEARELAEKVRRVARSDPQAALAACEVENDHFDLVAQNLSDEELAESFARGDSACRAALAMHSENVRALSVLASLYQRYLEHGGMEEDDPRPRLEQAAQIARRATSLDPIDGGAWKTLGDIYSMRSDWELFRGYDPREAAQQMSEAYERAVDLEPYRGRYLTALGNALSLRAELEMMNGGDPRQGVDHAAALYRRANEVDSHRGSELVNLAITLGATEPFLWNLGLDTGPDIAAGIDAIQRAIAINPNAYRPWRERARLELSKARSLARLGASSQQEIEAARLALGKALELYPEAIHSLNIAANIELSVLWQELRVGRDPSSAHKALDRVGDKILAEEPQWLATLLTSAAGARMHAAHHLQVRLEGNQGSATRTAAATQISRGYGYVERALEADPTSVMAKLEEGRLAMVEAALAASFSDAVKVRQATAKAEYAFQAVIESWPQRPDGYWAQAALLFQTAEAAATGHTAESAEFRRRAEQLERRGLDIWSRLAEQQPSDFVNNMARPQTQRQWLP